MKFPRVRLEFKAADFWVGAYWETTAVRLRNGNPATRYDLWVCLLPMVPLHVSWVRE